VAFFPHEAAVAPEVSVSWGFLDGLGTPPCYVGPDGAFVIAPAYDDARGFSEGLAAAKRDGKWGYIDKTGSWVIEPDLEDARDFHQGLAAARDPQSHQWGYVDKSGAWAVAPAWKTALPFCEEGVAPVGKQVGVRTSTQTTAQPVDGYGLIDRTGAEVVAVRAMDDPDRWQSLESFSDGVAVVQVADRYELVRPDGTFAVAPGFDRLGKQVEGLAPAEDGKKWGYIDATCAWAIPARYRMAASLSEGWAVVTDDTGVLHIDASGTPAYDTHFRNARPRTGGYAAVEAKHKWGFIDATANNMRVPPTYAKVGDVSFADGRGIVGRDAGSDYEWGWVDTTGAEGSQWFADVDRDGLSEGLLAVRVPRPEK